MRAYLELLRPANVVTAAADVLAGYAASGALGGVAFGVMAGTAGSALPWLLFSTMCLYAGGVVLNDFFDRGLDARERPERPIPSGRVSAATAGALGAILLIGGIIAGARVTPAAGWIAGIIALLCLLYDRWSKHLGIVGSLNMGACRAFNFLLGVAAIPAALSARWPLALLSLVYIAAVTALSRGEVSGGRRRVALGSFAALAVVILALAVLAFAGPWVVEAAAPPPPDALERQGFARSTPDVLAAMALAGLLAWRVLPPFWRACSDLTPAAIRQAIKAGVLSLVLLDAVIAAVYGGALYSLAVLATALIAQALSRAFAVT